MKAGFLLGWQFHELTRGSHCAPCPLDASPSCLLTCCPLISPRAPGSSCPDLSAEVSLALLMVCWTKSTDPTAWSVRKIHASLATRTQLALPFFCLLDFLGRSQITAFASPLLLSFSGLRQAPVFWVFQLQRTHFQTLLSCPLEIPLSRQWWRCHFRTLLPKGGWNSAQQ